jgi:formylglycine-generating enzyme required for sulfatase activity
MQADWTLMARQAREAGPDALSLLLLQARNLLLARHAELAAARPDDAPALDLDTPDLELLLDDLDDLADAAKVGDHSPPGQGSVWWRGQEALMADDLAVERLAVHAQRAGVPLRTLPVTEPRAFSPREPVGMPPSRVRLGSHGVPGAFAPPQEQPAHELDLPGFDIDATPVTWGQFLEFVEDGGYDDESCFTQEGQLWLKNQPDEADPTARTQGEARRAPRYVQQTRGAVVVQRFGRSVRVRLNEPVMHLSFWEAQAWCCWAGRRLPTEAEWTAAATLAARRGFVWGDVWEWTASRYRPFPGFAEMAPADLGSLLVPPGVDDLLTVGLRAGDQQVVKGGSFASSVRLRHPQYRGALHPDSDAPFVGFRSCAP